VTEGFIKHISNLGIESEKLHHVPNGTIPEIFNPSDIDIHLKAKLGLEGKFIITFAGNHGIAQGLDTIIESANQLKEHLDIVFFFIGEGPVKQSLIALKEKYHLSNVIFHPKVPIDQIAKYINMSDVLLVPLKKDEVFHTFIPSKMFDFMCCAKPIILSVDGEARQILEDKAKAGRFVPSEDATKLSNTILWLRENPELRSEYGRNGREFVLKEYLREQQAQKLESVMLSLAKDKT
jgi:glycosyltransferase involved in cell wall biosynthesis